MSETQANYSKSHEAQNEINEVNYQQHTITNNTTTTANTANNNSNNNSIITATSITTSGLVEERVKVDRKRFEQMLSEGSPIGSDADSFFKRVMRSTNTQIMWPPKLKPGTKSKKDPHVRITGSPNSIKSAKEIIFEQLDTRRNRVTLKMDVAFTDHSHIIGKGGRSIQRVMDETGCHIHFPDSNRTNTAEKSNQVSIAGSAEGVEQSRCRIREMLPITLQFDLPLNTGLHSPPTLDPESPQLQAIQQNYGITITFRCDGTKCNNSYFASSRIITVAVRGARSHLFGLRQGLSVLIEYLTGFRANSINVPLTMTIDVAVQHHSFIAGRANCNILTIMESTGAVITLPDLSLTLQQQQQSGNSTTPQPSLVTSNSCSSINTNLASSIGSISNRKTAIVIKGPNFESVYSAWQELLGYLPLILIFDLKEGQDLDAVQVTKLMEQMRQISILIKPKQRQNTKSIVVRGPEKDSRLLFEVRKQILKLDDSEMPNFTTTKANDMQQQQVIPSTTCNQRPSVLSQKSVTAAANQQNVELQMKAIKAMLKPNFEKTRQPTPYWAGLGFSKSVSEPMIKEKLSIGPLFSSNLIDERRISYSNELCGSLQSLSMDQNNQQQQLQPASSSSNVFSDLNNNIDYNNNSNNSTNNYNNNNNSTTASNTNQTTNLNINHNQKISSCLRLAVFLGRIGLVQYLGLFTQHDIDLEMLLNLTENDFVELGLPYIHRRKLAIAIAEVKTSLQQERTNSTLAASSSNNNISNVSSTFDAAPGAERSKRKKARCSNVGELSDIWSM